MRVGRSLGRLLCPDVIQPEYRSHHNHQGNTCTHQRTDGDVTMCAAGILMEGIGCVLAGLWGACAATTSYSENIGVIVVTKATSIFD